MSEREHPGASQPTRELVKRATGSIMERLKRPPDDEPLEIKERPAPMRRMLGILRRWTRLSLPDIYLLLAVAMIRRERFDEAGRALERALTEEGGIREDEALEDIAHAAREAKAEDLETWAVRVRDPAHRARRDLHPGAVDLLRPDAPPEHRVMVNDWLARADEVDPATGARFEARLLGARAALLADRDDAALRLLAEAVKDQPIRAPTAARRMLSESALPPRLVADEPAAHLLKARAYEVFGASEHRRGGEGGARRPGPRRSARGAGAGARASDARADDARPRQRSRRSLPCARQRRDLVRDHAGAVAAFERAARSTARTPSVWWYLADSRRLAAQSDSYPYRDFALLARAWDEWSTALDCVLRA